VALPTLPRSCSRYFGGQRLNKQVINKPPIHFSIKNHHHEYIQGVDKTIKTLKTGIKFALATLEEHRLVV
jgi:hypothetical protein